MKFFQPVEPPVTDALLMAIFVPGGAGEVGPFRDVFPLRCSLVLGRFFRWQVRRLPGDSYGDDGDITQLVGNIPQSDLQSHRDLLNCSPLSSAPTALPVQAEDCGDARELADPGQYDPDAVVVGAQNFRHPISGVGFDLRERR